MSETSKQPAPARSYRDLVVWQKAHAYVLNVYKATKRFPADERFGLTSQLRRASASIPANIAEGFVKRTKTDKARYIDIAHGSAQECSYFLLLAKDLGYLKTDRLANAIEEVSRLIGGYLKGLRR
ncbi:MAG: four helix bundle protein [Planctomycetota bacterium]